MAIQFFVHWDGMKPADYLAQEAPLADGRVGHLLVGEPWHPTYTLCRENRHTREAFIPAALLRQRLPATLRLLENLERVHAGVSGQEIPRILKNVQDFVAFRETKEKETGEPVLIMNIR